MPEQKQDNVTCMYMNALMSLNTALCEYVHSNSAFFLSRSRSGAVCCDSFGMNGDMYLRGDH